MRLRTIKFMIKEGFTNTWKNKLMCLASVGTVAASLIILGMFVLISKNVENIMLNIDSTQQIKAFIAEGTDQARIDEIKQKLQSNQFVKGVTIETKEQALQNVKKMKIFKDSPWMFDGYEKNNPFRSSFIIKIKKAQYGESVAQFLKSFPEIAKSKYDEETVKMIIKAMNILRIISFFLLVLLGITSLFIISNTIKLTIFARRKEIGIMKYIGATDWFIRWPFIFESIIIGVIASLIALVVVGVCYQALINFTVGNNQVAVLSANNLVRFDTVWKSIFFEYLIAGIGIGCFGSVLSLRKHLKV